MQTGLLWYDGDPNRGLVAKIEDAARRYREKFGQTPDTCYVSSVSLSKGGAQPTVSGISLRVVPVANVLPNHFWIGIEEAPNAVQPA